MVYSILKELVVTDTGLLLPQQTAHRFLPLLSFFLHSFLLLASLLCYSLSHCQGCLIIQALCHKAAEYSISHLLMASAFCLMFKTKRAPTPSLWTCSGWQISFCPQRTDFSQRKKYCLFMGECEPTILTLGKGCTPHALVSWTHKY